MNIREMRAALGDTQSEFAIRYNIPFRTIQNWETGKRTPPEYVVSMLGCRVNADLVNRKTITLPKYDSKKVDLPKRRDFIGTISWLKAINKYLGNDFVFALDEALMCQGSFKGRSDEYIIWGYGEDSACSFNGVVLLGNHINNLNVKEKDGLKFTDFNRTIMDALTNENILDMQGTIEALNRYFYSNGNSFEGIIIAPDYIDKFSKLAEYSINYYES